MSGLNFKKGDAVMEKLDAEEGSPLHSTEIVEVLKDGYVRTLTGRWYSSTGRGVDAQGKPCKPYAAIHHQRKARKLP